ncbi:M56 family metallopeptidase [uncultured Gordonia sp.]|uniref:M56 family metallopeptidase n=1 Tax=Gordonia sp. (in: high G+C Gram-positive bacteria) TaxID=84139 RepID=UPI000FB81F94|nr:M56 family metallopeptidase [uncultured Gordonia sp.]RUP36334.1 MAG: M56 family peptidase [Gordonia sp. (in: high G+C Gram-positive bacteria)]HNP57778.1 M56 family metallopeptidase [Gordonia sp. (in: high G+C Gram-positive bacteria)]
MSVAVCLLLYSLAVLAIAPNLLTRATANTAAPGPAVAAWLATAASVPLAWVTALGFLIDSLRGGRHTRLMSACFTVLRRVALGNGWPPARIAIVGIAVAAALAAALAAVVVTRLARTLLRSRSRTATHAQHVHLAGQRVDGIDAAIFDAPERLVYCVTGRPHAIVVTTAALQVLSEQQLAAVLAHERAHLRRHHHLIVTTTRALATALPRIPLFPRAAAEIARLLEMSADDAAAADHGNTAVLSALLSLISGTSVPAGALGATTIGTAARIHRLHQPPSRRHRVRAATILTACTAAAAAGPILAIALAASGLPLCGSGG